MTVYIDSLQDRGWVLNGHPTKSCHMITDGLDLTELHEMAAKIGMRREWFQDTNVPHYDLTPTRRAAAIQAGAIEVGHRRLVAVIRSRRAAEKFNDPWPI